MSDKIQENKKNKMCFFDYFTEVVGWLQIVASPLLAGLVVSALIYFPNPTTLKLIIAIAISVLALIVGIIFATRVWRKQGTMHFLSRVSATPELDDLEEEKNTKTTN